MAATPRPDTVVALRALAALANTHVAIISGRSLRDLAGLSRLPTEIHLVGSHGGEFDLGFGKRLSPRELDLRAHIKADLTDIAARTPGAELEVKPAAVTFHYRRSDRDDVRRALQDIEAGPAALDGVRTHHNDGSRRAARGRHRQGPGPRVTAPPGRRIGCPVLRRQPHRRTRLRHPAGPGCRCAGRRRRHPGPPPRRGHGGCGRGPGPPGPAAHRVGHRGRGGGHRRPLPAVGSAHGGHRHPRRAHHLVLRPPHRLLRRLRRAGRGPGRGLLRRLPRRRRRADRSALHRGHHGPRDPLVGVHRHRLPRHLRRAPRPSGGPQRPLPGHRRARPGPDRVRPPPGLRAPRHPPGHPGGWGRGRRHRRPHGVAVARACSGS